jgi:hypothetical protein
MMQIRVVLALALATLLAGCFASDRPLFSAETAVLALGDGGKFATFERVDGKETPDDPFDVRSGPNNVYEFVDVKGVVTPVTFHQLAGDEHVAQVKLRGDAGYGYLLIRTDGRELFSAPADCNKQDEATMTALGVVRRNDYECRIDKIADPAAFFKGLKRGEPITRMVRE